MQLKDIRTALFGFNKNDVCEYISHLNSVYEEKERKKGLEQAELLEELSLKNENLSNDASRLSQENTELKRVNDELRKKIDAFECESDELKNKIKEICGTIAAALEEVKSQLNPAEKEIENLFLGQENENEEITEENKDKNQPLAV